MQKEVVLLSRHANPNRRPRPLRARDRSVQEAAPIRTPVPGTAAVVVESRIGGFFKEGYELAFEQATQSGGISVGGQKMPVRLTLLDDTSTQATAASLADRLINSDKVHFLLGTYATNLVEAQSVVAEQNNIPFVNG